MVSSDHEKSEPATEKNVVASPCGPGDVGNVVLKELITQMPRVSNRVSQVSLVVKSTKIRR
jgi:hypothetical protein